jgi:copper homeostasis protein (lipoprotein)
MKYFILCLVMFCTCSLSGCSGVAQNEAKVEDTVEIRPFSLPATFTGDIPCPDCKRVDITLNLRPDTIYQLRKTYQSEMGPIKVEAQLGRWRFAEDGKFVILGKTKGSLKSYAVTDENHLKFVGLESVGGSSQIEYVMLRGLDIDPFIDVVKLRGMLKYEHGKAVITECTSGQSFPVTGDAEYQRLEQTYLNTPHDYAQPLLVSIKAQIVKDASGVEEVVVDNFKRFYPEQDCDGNQTYSNLTGTIWSLHELEGKSVGLDSKGQRLFFSLDAKGKKLRGVGICNTISATYLVTGEVFLINRLISTRMACPNGIELEASFLQALDTTETYQITGDLLYLRDQNGTTIAILKANN